MVISLFNARNTFRGSCFDPVSVRNTTDNRCFYSNSEVVYREISCRGKVISPKRLFHSTIINSVCCVDDYRQNREILSIKFHKIYFLKSLLKY